MCRIAALLQLQLQRVGRRLVVLELLLQAHYGRIRLGDGVRGERGGCRLALGDGVRRLELRQVDDLGA